MSSGCALSSGPTRPPATGSPPGCRACLRHAEEQARRERGAQPRYLIDAGATEKRCSGTRCGGKVWPLEAYTRCEESPDGRGSKCPVCRGITGKPPGTPAVYAPVITKADAAGWPPVIDIRTAAAALNVSFDALARSPRSPVDFVTVSGRRKVLSASVIRLLPGAPAPGGDHTRRNAIRAAVGMACPAGSPWANSTDSSAPGGAPWLRRYVSRMADRGELARMGRGRYALPAAP